MGYACTFSSPAQRMTEGASYRRREAPSTPSHSLRGRHLGRLAVPLPRCAGEEKACVNGGDRGGGKP